jgi:hypothetical protein
VAGTRKKVILSAMCSLRVVLPRTTARLQMAADPLSSFPAASAFQAAVLPTLRSTRGRRRRRRGGKNRRKQRKTGERCSAPLDAE